MALNSLFNLDPSKYSLGKGSGTFRRVGESAPSRMEIDLGSLLSGIQKPGTFDKSAPAAPSFPTVTPLNLGELPKVNPLAPFTPPTVNPLDQTLVPRYQTASTSIESMIAAVMKSNSKGVSDPGSYAEQRALAIRDLSIPSSQYLEWAKKNAKYGGDYGDRLADQQRQFAAWSDQFLTSKTQIQTVVPSIQADSARYNSEVSAYKSAVEAYKPQVDQYNSQVSTYQSALEQRKPQIERYNSEVSAYNAVFDPYKEQVDAYSSAAKEYNAKISEYNTQRNSTVNNAYAEYQTSATVSPDKRRIASAGEQLGETELYSDDLHNQMIQSIGTARSDPAPDAVSSLFASRT